MRKIEHGASSVLRLRGLRELAEGAHAQRRLDLFGGSYASVEPFDEKREGEAVDETEHEPQGHVALGLWPDLSSADGRLDENGSRPLERLGRVQTPEILAELDVER